MAERQEIFSAQFNIKHSGVDSLTKALKGLDEAASKVTKTLDGISKVSVSLRRVSSDTEKFASRISELNGHFSIGERGGIKGWISDLEKFALVFKETFGTFDSVEDFDAAVKKAAISVGSTTEKVRKVLLDMQTRNKDIFNFIPESAEEAKSKTVDESPIPDLVKAVTNILAKMKEVNPFAFLPENATAATEETVDGVQVSINSLVDSLSKVHEVDEAFQKNEATTSELRSAYGHALVATNRFKDSMAELGLESKDTAVLLTQAGARIHQANDKLFDAEKVSQSLTEKVRGLSSAYSYAGEGIEAAIKKVQAEGAKLGEKLKIDQIAEGFSEISPAAAKAFEKVEAAAKETEVALNKVTQSVARKSVEEFEEMSIKIQALLSDIPDKGDEAYIRLRETFKKINQEAAKQAKGVPGPDKDTPPQFTGTVEEDTFTRAQQLAEQVGQTIDTMRRERIGALVQDFDKLRASGINTTVTLSERFRGLGLALTTPGARLQGLREAISGVSSEGGAVTKFLDRLVAGTGQIDKINNKFIKQAVQIVKASEGEVASLKNQFDLVKRVALEEKNRSDVVEELDKQLTRVESNMAQFIVTAKKGGDVTGILTRVQEEIDRTEQKYKQLVESGIIPVGSATEQILARTISDLKRQEQALQAVNVRYEASRVAAKEAAAAAAEHGDEVQKTAGIFGKLRIVFGRDGIFARFQRDGEVSLGFLGRLKLEFVKFFDITRKGGDKTAKDMEKVGKSILALQKPVNLFKAVFAGAFTGTLAGTFISSLLPITGIVDDIATRLRQLPAAMTASASEAAETQNRFAAVFGEENLGAAEEFVAVLASEVGRDPFKIKASISEFQAFAKGMEFNNDQAVDLSTRLQRLTLDFASFNNLSDAEASEKFIAGLSGSSEVFDRYGINIRDSAVQQKLWELGIRKSSAELSEQEKVMGRLAIISEAMGTQGAIGDAVTTADSFANQTKRLNDNISQFVTQMGQSLLPVLQPVLQALNTLAQNVFPQVVAGFTQLTTAAQPFAEAFAAALTGNFSQLNEVFAPLISNLQTLVTDAFNWGFSLIDQLASGVFDAAGTILQDAVNYVGEIMASFLMPGSPPEKGPLSTIDEWGGGLSQAFSEGFQLDTHAITQALDPVRQEFENLGKGGEFSGVQNLVDSLASNFQTTGILDEGMLAELEKQVGKARADQIRQAVVAGKQQDKAVTQQQAAIDTQKQGLKDVKSLSEGASRSAVDGLKKEKETALDRYNAEMAAIEERKNLGELTEQEYLEARIKAEETWLKAKENTDKAATVSTLERLRVELAAQQQQGLEENLKTGIIKEEEFLREKIKILEKEAEYADVHRKTEIGKEIQGYEARLEAIKEANKKSGGGAGFATGVDQSLFEQALPDLPEMQKKIQEVGGAVATGFIQGLKEKLAGVKDTVVNGVKDRISTAFRDLQAYFKTLPYDKMFPLTILVGVFAFPFVEKALGLVDLLFKAIIGLPKAFTVFPRLIGFLAPFLKLLFRFSLAGFIVIGFITNFDAIMEETSIIVAEVGAVFSETYDDFRIFFSTLLENKDVVGSITSSFTLLGQLITQLVAGAFKILKKGFKVAVIGSLVIALEAANKFVEAMGGAEALAKRVGEALVGVFGPIKDFLFDVVAGVDLLLNARYEEGFALIKDAFKTFDVEGVLGSISSFATEAGTVLWQTIVDQAAHIFTLLPPETQAKILAFRDQITTTFESISASFAGFFSEGRLGGELILLFQQIGASLKQAFGPESIGLLKILGVILGTIVAVAANILVSAFQALAQTLPFIEQLLRGVVEIIRGAVQVVSALFGILQALGLAIVDLVTSGEISESTKAFFGETVVNLQAGLATLTQGIITTVSNLILTALSLLNTFIINFIENILYYVPQLETFFAPMLNGAKLIQEFLVDLGPEIATIIARLFTDTGAVIGEGIAGWLDYFYGFYDSLIGNSIIPDTVTGIVKWLTVTLPTDILAALPGLITSLVDGFVELGSSLLSAIISGLSGTGEGGGIGGAIKNVLGNVVSSGSSFLSSIFGGEEGAAAPPGTDTAAQTALIATTQTTLATLQLAYTNFTTIVRTAFGTLHSLIVGTYLPEIATAGASTFTGFTTIFITSMETLIAVIDEVMPGISVKLALHAENMADSALGVFRTLADESLKIFDIKKWEVLGASIITGLIRGIDKNKSGLVKKIRDVIQDVLGTAATELGTASPSYKFEKLALDSMEGAEIGFEKGGLKLTDSVNRVFRSFFFKINKALGAPKEKLDEVTRASVAEYGEVFTDAFLKAGQELDKAERTRIENLLAFATKTPVERLAVKIRGDFGIGLDKFIERAFNDFRAKADQLVKDQLSLADNLLKLADETAKALGEKILQLHDQAGFALFETDTLLGRHIEIEELRRMAADIRAGTADFGTDANTAILRAVNLQEELNSAVAEEVKAKKELAKIEEQRSKVELLKQRLGILEQIKSNGLDPKILAGLNLGPGASVTDVLQATSITLEALIKKSQKALGLPSAAGGAFPTTEGLFKLHEGEMVLPARLVEGLAKAINLIPTAAILQTQLGGLSLEQAAAVGGSRGGDIYIQPTINTGMDYAKFKNDVLKIVKGDIRTR